MSPKKIITRFAPSPTGLLHSGNYRTAIFAYLFAKKTGGEFNIRIEDTDLELSKKEYEDNIWETIEWLGLSPDRTFRQSEHRARHRELLEKLIADGKAYISKEQPRKEGDREEVIRFRNPNTKITFRDAIRGDITTTTVDLGDFVIARSLDEPVFHFAVVVDDADMGATHIVRGEDHIPNTARQILIGQALGFETPIYAHIPLVLGSDRAKLSKRRGAKPLTEYRDEGYLPEAMINYLALVGWHPEGEQEIFSIEELIREFSLERIQKSAGIFDEVKLKWFNHEHLKRLSDEEYAKRLAIFTGADADLKYVPLLKERSDTLQDAALALAELQDIQKNVSFDKELLLKGAKADAGEVAGHLARVEELVADMKAPLSAEAAKEALFPYATEVGRSKVLWPLRVALSGKEKSPDPFTLCGILGKETVLARIRTARNMLQ
jgi:glutamyl-tRNA synthetase